MDYEVNRIVTLIRNNEWEKNAYEYGWKKLSPQDCFQQNIGSSNVYKLKIDVMFMMSRKNLKFPQLETINNDNPQELHHLLMDLFGTTDDNRLRMIHILACMVNSKSNNAIVNLFDTVTQGQTILMERWGRTGMTYLHLACQYNASDNVIHKLIDVGGKDLIMATENDGYNTLHWACKYNASDNVITKLVNVGGKDLTMATTNNGRTALHCTCQKNGSDDVITKLIGVGGKKLIMATDNYGRTALHWVCQNNASDNTIHKLADVGGEELIMATDNYGCTALHFACQNNSSDNTIHTLINVGGKELILATHKYGRTALHFACQNNASDNTIHKLIDVGGKELIMTTDTDKSTVLYWAFKYNVSNDVINKLIDVGGKELLSANGNGEEYPLLSLICTPYHIENKNTKVSLLILKGIQLHVGGEFGIGGLFNFASEEGQHIIYQEQKWNNIILPALENENALISSQPILQAAIIAKAPRYIIRDIIRQFDCINTQDNKNQYPIHTGIAEGLKWEEEGLKDIFHAHCTASLMADQSGQTRLMINVAALHGLKWENGMEQVVEESMNEVGNNNVDALTGLLPFMIAAVGNSSDLSSIYELMIKIPHNVKSLNQPM